jgi:hypothetical protein
MSQHSSVVGGSTATRVLACPGSIDLCRKLPKETSSIYAAIGTACHEIMEAWLMEQPTLTHELVPTHVQAAKILPAQEWFRRNWTQDVTYHVERSVNFGERIVDPLTGERAYGTADVVWRHDNGRAGIIDWKFGDGHLVSAENNDQMRFYLAAAIRSGYLPKLDRYEAWIFQPSMKLAPDKFASRGRYSLADLEAFEDRLADAVTTLPRPFATGLHCHWCRAKHICDAWLDQEFGDAREVMKAHRR